MRTSPFFCTKSTLLTWRATEPSNTLFIPVIKLYRSFIWTAGKTYSLTVTTDVFNFRYIMPSFSYFNISLYLLGSHVPSAYFCHYYMLTNNFRACKCNRKASWLLIHARALQFNRTRSELHFVFAYTCSLGNSYCTVFIEICWRL